MGLLYLIKEASFRKNYEKKVDQAAKYISKYIKGETPHFGVTLGSGLGDLADSIENATIIPYEDIPNFPTTTVQGHEGKLVIGTLEGVPVIGLKGRKHYYEGADELFNNGMLRSVFGIHTLANLGVKNYFVTNASGGLNQDFKVGDIMIINSHINLLPNPLLGKVRNFTTLDGKKLERFQPMNESYDPDLKKILSMAAFPFKDNVHGGVYLATSGPTYETEGESISFRDGFFADVVGMSTTPEVIIARNRGMKVVGMSCVTNMITKNGINATNHNEVKKILESYAVKNRLETTVRNFFSLYRKSCE